MHIRFFDFEPKFKFLYNNVRKKIVHPKAGPSAFVWLLLFSYPAYSIQKCYLTLSIPAITYWAFQFNHSLKKEKKKKKKTRKCIDFLEIFSSKGFLAPCPFTGSDKKGYLLSKHRGEQSGLSIKNIYPPPTYVSKVC